MTVLIVCEGKETEPAYFRSLSRRTKLAEKASVELCGDECGSDPKRVVNRAIGRKQQEKLGGAPFSEVWCVFDRNGHEGVSQALAAAEKHGVRVAFSNPCFELWYCLHFEYSTGQMTASQALGRMQSHIRGYAKSMDVCDRIAGQQSEAIKRARQLRQHHERTRPHDQLPLAEVCPDDNPSTTVDLLVDYLEKVARERL